MCSISGIVSLEGMPSDKSILLSMNDVLKHRGPDDNGLFIDDWVGFVHNRLSIVDTTDCGHQPMTTKDERYIIVFNGEIYNHLEIRSELIKRGYQFKSESDTETLLIAYVEYGKKILDILNGIFAFAIYDKVKQKVFLARDHMGVKPLYYSLVDNKTLIFASEIKSILKHPFVSKKLDHQAILSYIQLLWCPGEQTPLSHVKKLLPGHYIELSLTKDRWATDIAQKYYHVPFNGNYSSLKESELISQLDEKLRKAVERQLMSDVPLGFFLSGGLDSSLVATIASQLIGKKIDCFTINSGDELSKEGFVNDLTYARSLAQSKGYNLHEVNADVNVLDDFDKMVWYLDEPQADPASFNVYNISNTARSMGIKVLLGGTAGDDVFSGYRRHQALHYEKYMKAIPGFLKQGIRKWTETQDLNHAIYRRMKKLFSHTGLDDDTRMIMYFFWLEKERAVPLFHKDIHSQFEDYYTKNYFFDLLKQIPDEPSRLNKLLYLELNTFLVDHNLSYTDKMSMAAGVETRVPFLDKDLVDFSTTIPPQYKMKGVDTKYILKKVAEKYLPNDIIRRPKAGFGAPLRKWITEDMDEMIHDRLSAKRINERGLFDAQAVWKLIDDNKKGNIDASYSIWSLLAIESWISQFIDQ